MQCWLAAQVSTLWPLPAASTGINAVASARSQHRYQRCGLCPQHSASAQQRSIAFPALPHAGVTPDEAAAAVVDSTSEFAVVVQYTLGSFSVVMAAEVDCCQAAGEGEAPVYMELKVAKWVAGGRICVRICVWGGVGVGVGGGCCVGAVGECGEL
jgi:hypothetical protein